MWIEELTLENIKCFEKIRLRFGDKNGPAPWVTLLSENGSGKTTILQAIAIMLAGPESAVQLLPRPIGWLKKETVPGKISARIHKDPGDSGSFGTDKKRSAFGYSMHVTGRKPLSIRNKTHTSPGLHESPEKILSWLRQNAFSPQSDGWFAVGYGAFRRLTRSSQVIVPTLENPTRYSNFLSQFDEAEGLAAFERWMIYLDYREAKEKDPQARARKEMGISAINELLPTGTRYDSIDGDGRILFNVNGSKVPTVALSDGYRSVLALAGDLVWRMITAFPSSDEPLKEHGVVLIDELDIHLHPMWQRYIASWLRAQFPKIQFIVTTHSPMVAAGAGPDAMTLKLTGDGVAARQIRQSLFAMDVDDILKSEAFGLISTYAPATQEKLDRLSKLQAKPKKLNAAESKEIAQLSLFVKEHNPRNSKIARRHESDLDKFVRKMVP
jgi:predicted ATP-binding protein involved in virulence